MQFEPRQVHSMYILRSPHSHVGLQWMAYLPSVLGTDLLWWKILSCIGYQHRKAIWQRTHCTVIACFLRIIRRKIKQFLILLVVIVQFETGLNSLNRQWWRMILVMIHAIMWLLVWGVGMCVSMFAKGYVHCYQFLSDQSLLSLSCDFLAMSL